MCALTKCVKNDYDDKFCRSFLEHGLCKGKEFSKQVSTTSSKKGIEPGHAPFRSFSH